MTGGTIQSRLTLDCPGFSNFGSRWAYTYSDLTDIYVRFRDPALVGGAAQTRAVTSGVLGNVPMSGSYKMFSPTVNYDFISPTFGIPNDIMVAWYATDGAGFNKYVGLKMDPTGTFLTITAPPYDYLDLPNAQTPTTPNPLFSGIALNKTDVKAPSSYSYATYFVMDPVTGMYQLHHAFHTWGSPSFRGLPPETEEPGQSQITDSRISAYPNPFSDQFSVTVTTAQNSVVELLLTDINGRTVAQTNHVVYKGSHQINLDKLDNLASGNYLLSVLVDQKKVAVKKVTKQ